MESIKEQIIQLIRTLDDNDLIVALKQYHENDIADAFASLEQYELDHLYKILPNEFLSEIFTYLDDAASYVEEMDNDQVADIIEEMDSDDAVDFLEELKESDDFNQEDYEEIKVLIDDDALEDIALINSYADNQIGSKMTTNYITTMASGTVKKSMRDVIREAAENDNINVIYALNDDNTYNGVILLRDLICARGDDNLEDIINTNYPVLFDTQETTECYDILRDYDLDSIAVLNKKKELIGIITLSDIMEIMEDELQEDYNKFAGVNVDNDLNEPVFKSVYKRIPWLFVLLVISLFVSMITSAFENIVISLTTIVFFQSLILDMAGNVGTQSLAVTIQSSDNSKYNAAKIISKEVFTGFINGLIIGVSSFVVISGFLLLTGKGIDISLKTSISVGISMLVAIVLSSFTGSSIPLLLTRLGIDPAAASGPFITTTNDILAVLIYYGLASLLFMVL